MARIRIECDVNVDMTDELDATGITDDAYTALITLLVGWGADDINVQQTA